MSKARDLMRGHSKATVLQRTFYLKFNLQNLRYGFTSQRLQSKAGFTCGLLLFIYLGLTWNKYIHIHITTTTLTLLQ